jgi:glycosyltransferase involved in cell wall biosynthesis
MTRLLFIHHKLSSFVRFDLESLRAHFEVTERPLMSRAFNPLGLWQEISEHDLVFGWFASWHTFLPVLWARLQHKPSILVVGGYDVANLPEIGYGHQRGGIRQWVSRFAMNLASSLVTNSYYSRDEAVANAGIAREKLDVIYHGLPDPFGELPGGRRARTVLTVGNVNRSNLQRKGLRPFVRAAARIPDATFTVVGAWQDDAIDELRATAPPNVRFTGELSDEKLREQYRQASVYVQASRHEGFGLSLAEAMMAGCIPVATRAGSLPEVVGDCGVFCKSQEPDNVAEAIRSALDFPERARFQARQRILDRFPAEKRREALRLLVSRLSRNETSSRAAGGR